MKILDTRDLNKRKEELESLRDAVNDARESLETARESLAKFDPECPNVAPGDEKWHEEKEELEEAISDAEYELECALSDFGDDEKEELAELEELESEISDWRHGETLIHEDCFEDYAREMAEDIHGRAISDAQWPFTCIDWKEAAEELAQDYTTVTYQGEDYLVRS